jgi:hypothetical protein
VSGSTSILDALPTATLPGGAPPPAPQPQTSAAASSPVTAAPDGTLQVTVTAKRPTGSTSILDSLPTATLPGDGQPSGDQGPTLGSMGQQLWTGVKQGIAAQGNAALTDPNTALIGAPPSSPLGPYGVPIPQGPAPRNFWERTANTVGQLLPMLPTAAIGAESAPAALGSIARQAIPTVGAAVGSQIGQDIAPPSLQPLASVGGALLGGGAAALGQSGLSASLNSIRNALTGNGFGLKQTVTLPNGDIIRATPGQQAAAANRLYQAGGENLRQALNNDPLATTLGDLQTRLQSPDVQANPELQQELQGRVQAAQTAMASRGSQYERVPGEQPILGQVAPLPEVLQGQRAAALNPNEQFGGPAFQERAGVQNTARLGAIEAQGVPSANPEALGDYFVNRLADLDSQHTAAEAGARADIQQRTEALAGTVAPQALGEAMTSAVQDAQKPVVDARRQLWAAVDPDKTWALPASGTKQAATNLLNELSPAAVERLGGNERSLLQEAANLPDVARFRYLSSLRSDLNAGMREAGFSQGWSSPAVRRLQIVKQAIDSDIGSAVSQKAAREAQAVAAGTMADQETMAWRLNMEASANDWLRQRQSAANLGREAGGLGQAGAGGVYSTRGPSAFSGMGGTGRSTAGGSRPSAGMAAGPQQPLEPNFPPGAGERYKAAVAATRAEKERFGQGVTGKILAAGRNGEEFAMKRSDVPGAVISGGASQGEDIANYLRATDNSSAGVTALEQAIAAKLRQAGIIDPDGMVNATKLAKYRSQQSPTLEQLPGISAALKDVNASQEALNRTIAANRNKAHAFQNSIARKFLQGQDPRTAVYDALSGRGSAKNLNAIIEAVGGGQGNADAIASLKQHVVDYMLDRFAPESTASATEERGALKGVAFRKWLGENRGPLKRLFGGQGVQNFEFVDSSLHKGMARAPAVVGSQTTPYALNAGRAGLHAGEGDKGIGTTLAAILGEHIAEGAGHHPLVGIGLGILGKAFIARMRAAGMRNVNDLVGAAYLHPEFAKALLTRVPSGGLTGMGAKRVAAALQRALVLGTISNSTQRDNNGQ